MNIPEYMNQVGQRARAASRVLARASTAQKNAALLAMAVAMEKDRALLLAENRKDMDAGKKSGLDAGDHIV